MATTLASPTPISGGGASANPLSRIQNEEGCVVVVSLFECVSSLIVIFFAGVLNAHRGFSIRDELRSGFTSGYVFTSLGLF